MPSSVCLTAIPRFIDVHGGRLKPRSAGSFKGLLMPPDDQTPSRHRFFCPVLPKPAIPETGPVESPVVTGIAGGGGVSDARCTLDRQESHHARKVLRLSVGDPVELFDGQGALAQASIEKYDAAARALCHIISTQHQPPIIPSITVASAVPKGPRADAMVAQLSQLGVDRFIPLQADHSVAAPSPARLERFAKSAIESAKQCRRLWLMRVEEPHTPADAWAEEGYDLKLITAQGCDPLPDLADRLRSSRNVLVLVGPEGGWSPAERASSTDAGCLNWSIAPNVLRIETAATAAAVLRYLGLP